MSLKSFFVSLENGAAKVASFIIKQMTTAEDLLGADTGSEKANIVITAVEGALKVLGIDSSLAQNELKAVLDALTAFFNKVGLFQTSTTPTSSAGSSVVAAAKTDSAATK